MRIILLFLLFIITPIVAQKTEIELIQEFKPSFDPIFAYLSAHDTIPDANASFLKQELSNNSIAASYYVNGLKLLYARSIFRADVTTALKVLKEVNFFLDKNPHFIHLKLVHNMILARIQLETEADCEGAFNLYKEKYNELSNYKEFDSQWKIIPETKKGYINSLLCLEQEVEALELLKEFEKEISGDNQENELAYVWGTTGFIYLKLGNNPEAEKYCRKVITLTKNSSKNLKSYFTAVNNLCLASTSESSTKLLEEAIVRAKKENVTNEILLLSNTLVGRYFDQEEIAKGMQVATYVLDNTDSVTYYYHHITTKGHLAVHYYNEEKYDKASIYTDEVIRFFRANQNTQMLRAYLGLKNKILLRLEKFEAAAAINAEIISMLDSTSLSDNMQSLQRSLVEYETEKKDNEILILTQKDEINRFQLAQQRQLFGIVSIAVITLLLLGLMYFYYRKKIAKIEELSMQSKLARSQFNPHYINNAFTSLQSKLLEQDFDENLINYTASISRFSRSLLESSFQDEWTIQQEKMMLEAYLKTQQFRLENGFEFEINSNLNREELQQYKMPSALSQTILENAIEHGGYSSKNPSGKISISIQKTANNLSLSFSNNIIENNSDTTVSKRAKDEPARGLDILKQRLLLHGKINQKPTNFRFEQQENKTIVSIELPLITV